MNGKINRESIIYAFAHVEAWLEAYARSCQASVHELTERVGELLLAQGKGIEHRMSALRGPSSEVGDAMGALEVDERPHRKAQVKRVLSKKARAAISKAQKKRWGKWKVAQIIAREPKVFTVRKNKRSRKYPARKISCKLCGKKVTNYAMGAHYKKEHA